jgi:tetratricopeptide (TPR) repeat protein
LTYLKNSLKGSLNKTYLKEGVLFFMELSEINELMQKGDYIQVLQLIKKLPPEEHLDGMILKGRVLVRKGDLLEALKTAEEALKESRTSGTISQLVFALINCGFALLALRKMDELEEIIHEGEDLFTKLQNIQDHIKKEWQGSILYLQGYFNLMKGEIRQSLESLERSLLIRQGLGNQHDVVDSLTAIGWVHINATGKVKLSLDYFQRSLDISEKLGNKTAIAHSLNRVGNSYSETGNFDKDLTYYEKSLAIYQELENRPWISGLLNNIALIYRSQERYDLALDYLEKALEIDLQIGNEEWIAMVHNNIGWLHLDTTGDYDLALDHLNKSLVLYEEISNKIGIIRQKLHIGVIYFFKGNLNAAFNYMNDSLILSEEMESEESLVNALGWLSMVFTLQGELEKALEYNQKALNISTKLDRKIRIAWCKVNLGNIYKQLGKLELSLTTLTEALDLIENTLAGGRLSFWRSWIFFYLILLYQDLNEIEKAEFYLKRIQEVQQQSKDKFVKLHASFAEAIVLKMSQRGVNKFLALQKFQAIVDDEILSHHITTLSLINLCEILILEIKISDKPEELLLEVSRYSEKIYEIAQSQKSAWLTVLALILKTKLALVRGKTEEANTLLSTAKQIATEKKLGNLLLKVKSEQETVQAELNKWDEMFQRQASIQERIEQAKVADYLLEAKKIQEAWVQPSAELIDQ